MLCFLFLFAETDAEDHDPLLQQCEAQAPAEDRLLRPVWPRLHGRYRHEGTVLNLIEKRKNGTKK